MEKQQEGGKSQEDSPNSPTAPPPSGQRRKWLHLLLVGGGVLAVLSVVGALIGGFHEEIIEGIYWCQDKRPWSAVLYGVFVILGRWVGGWVERWVGDV